MNIMQIEIFWLLYNKAKVKWKCNIHFSAVKQLIVSKIKVFAYIIYVRVLCIFIMYIQIHTHACMCLRKICYIWYIKYIYI